jgi:hypothetical protein
MELINHNLKHKTMQQDSPIPMQDQDENKQPPSNATELHDEGLIAIYRAILKQDANKMKKQLQKIELGKTNYENEQKDE